MPSEPPLGMHLSDILPENSAPFLCAGNGALFAMTWGGRVAIGKAQLPCSRSQARQERPAERQPVRRMEKSVPGAPGADPRHVHAVAVAVKSVPGASGTTMANQVDAAYGRSRVRLGLAVSTFHRDAWEQPTPGAPGRSQQQCQHQVGPRRTRRGRVRGHRMADPKRIGAVVHAATESVSSALAGLDARFARTRASAREGYSPFSALALRAFSMICVGESKSSVLALPGATHSSRCLTTMPMFST